MIKHSQSTQSNKFAISLQNFKIEVRDGVHFLHANKHQSFYKLALSFLMEVARKLVMFLQYSKKKVLQLLLCSVFYWDVKHSDILQGSNHVHCYLYILNIFLQIIKTSVAEFNFSKVPCFQQILQNTFRQTRLKYENYSLRHLILGIQTAFILQKLYYKVFSWKHVELKVVNPIHVIKKLVGSWQDVHFGLHAHF